MAAQALSGASSQFLSLPYELQLRILSYTDLITPLSVVKWDPHDRYHLGIERAQSCDPLHGALCSPPYNQCHPDQHTICCGQLRPTESDVSNDNDIENPREYCRCVHASEPRVLMDMASCRRCTHFACQFLPLHKADHNSSVHWTPPTALFLVSQSFREISFAIFFGRNHFQIGCSHSKAYRNLVDWNDYCKRSISDRKHLLSLPPSRAGPSIFLCEILPKDARHLLQSMEIDLSGIASYAAMQEWLHVAQEVGLQLRLKMLCLQGESPVDGLQEVADWGHGQDPTECVRLAREEAGAWMWPPLKAGAAAIAVAAAGGQGIAGRRLELFMVKIVCASSCIRGDGEDTVWYSILNPARATVGESLPHRCHGLNRDHKFVLPKWYYHVPIDVETPPLAAEASLSSGSGHPESESWVEGILVSCWRPHYGISQENSDHAE